MRRCLLFVVAMAVANADAQDAVPSVAQRCVATVVPGLDARAAETVPRLRGVGGQLLAIRSYLRAGTGFGERWSWSTAQIAAYQGSAEQQLLQREIERVQSAFAERNPGYSLFVNTQVRSLDLQIERWNSNASVQKAAAALLDATTRLRVPAEAGAESITIAASCRTFLASYVPHPTPTLAAPGLSPHGQMRAIDFQIRQGTRTVAGPSTATIAREWEAPGWVQKLQDAVKQAGPAFSGPLRTPYEPWHYTYVPAAPRQ